MTAYPLDHGRGYVALPVDVAGLDPIMRDGVVARAYLLILCRVRRNPGWFHSHHGDVYLERGQCVIGLREIAARIGVAPNTARRAITVLEKVGIIARNAAHRGTVVTVLKYGEFGISAESACTDPDTVPAQTLNPNEREKGKGTPPPRAKRAVRKIPFTIPELARSFKAGAGSRFADGAYDRRLSKSLTSVILELDAAGKTLADVEAAGRYIATRWSTTEPVSYGWLATTGKLMDVIAKVGTNGAGKRLTVDFGETR